VQDAFPWLKPSVQGHSILLTTPALLIAVGAGLRERLNQVLWGAVILTAIPVFLYYGGGGAATYGYRYAMDFVPFLLALVAIAMRERFGNLERILIGLSLCFVCYGYIWQIYK
jgi:peptidoglycan/LPS O-acetylase OafA/YrhL